MLFKLSNLNSNLALTLGYLNHRGVHELASHHTNVCKIGQQQLIAFKLGFILDFNFKLEHKQF